MKRVFYLPVICFFGLAAFQESDKASDAVADGERTPLSRSLSVTPRSFYDLEVFEILSKQLDDVSLGHVPAQTPVSAQTPHMVPTNIFTRATQIERETRHLQAKKLRAAIRCITAQEKKPLPEEPINTKRSREESASSEGFCEYEGSPVSPAKSRARQSATEETADLPNFGTETDQTRQPK